MILKLMSNVLEGEEFGRGKGQEIRRFWESLGKSGFGRSREVGSLIKPEKVRQQSHLADTTKQGDRKNSKLSK